MRKIIMKTISSGPEGVFLPGSSQTLPDHKADQYVRGGFAEYAVVGPGRVAIKIPAETAIIEPEETGVEIAKPHRGRPKK